VIVRLADAWHADLLLVGPDRGHTGSGMAQRLVEGSACPVLAVPTPATPV
jgi:nucleotide-binding universal stress UspA family protein